MTNQEGGPTVDKVQQFLNALPTTIRPIVVSLLAAGGGAQLAALIAEYGPVDAASMVVAIFTAVGGLAAGAFGWLAAK
ncbi:hypothetical protein ABW16_21635 [Mycolicibacter heraklionensis]|uniref:Holin n=1 Tax=Mycolicibacter heraklionensis TaxID=512402 RepID=A0ABR5FA45_9MYCO|nr:hypothetical protein [Mycolicibacter heraklionensis]KLO25913.1 hypothetical protein ABW16_21635 [Mycolicibacter heraklionensis]